MTESGQVAAPGGKRAPGTRWWRFGLLAAGIGLPLCLCGPIGVASLVLVPLGAGALALGFLLWDRSFAGGAAPLRIVLGGSVVLGVMLLPLSLGGFVIRHFDRGDYLRWYGTHVQATVDTRNCQWINRGRNGNSDTMGCQGVTWTIDGRQQTGSMEIKGQDDPATPGTPVIQVSGYALGDAAVSDRRIRGIGAGRTGAVPLWVGGIALLLVGAGSGGLSALNRRKRS